MVGSNLRQMVVAVRLGGRGCVIGGKVKATVFLSGWLSMLVETGLSSLGQGDVAYTTDPGHQELFNSLDLVRIVLFHRFKAASRVTGQEVALGILR